MTIYTFLSFKERIRQIICSQLQSPYISVGPNVSARTIIFDSNFGLGGQKLISVLDQNHFSSAGKPLVFVNTSMKPYVTSHICNCRVNRITATCTAADAAYIFHFKAVHQTDCVGYNPLSLRPFRSYYVTHAHHLSIVRLWKYRKPQMSCQRYHYRTGRTNLEEKLYAKIKMAYQTLTKTKI